MTDRGHLLLIVLSLAMLACVGILLHLVRRRRLRGKYGLLWISVAVALVPLAVFPTLVDTVADEVGIKYQPTLIILAAIGLLMLLAMHFTWELSRLEERSRTLAEEVALLRQELEAQRPGSSTDPGGGGPGV